MRISYSFEDFVTSTLSALNGRIMARLFFATQGGGGKHTGSMPTDDNEGVRRIDRQYSLI